MSANQITIAIDAMGGDGSPLKVLKGVEIFLVKNYNVNIILLGTKDKIQSIIKSHKLDINNVQIINTLNNITNEDSANDIIRNRKDSSIYKGLEIVKQINQSGFVSAGNTAALMILSKLKLGMINGIDRPAFCSVIPNNIDFSIMLDLGANVSVNSKNLLQFAVMGFCYHSILKPNIKPKIGIINIGTEVNKGLELLQDASDLLSQSFLKEYFIGFIEPNKITSGVCDIMVCDGYTGNIILKTAEGMSQYITDNLKNIFLKNIFNKISYKFLEKDFLKLKDKINPDKYNGATLIGVNGISIKSHGSASPEAFYFAIERCYKFINNNINGKIRNQFNDI